MMQGKEELNKFYSKIDPWGYKSNKEDEKRKKIILENIKDQYKRALDLGCGEGFITQDLPADEIYGYDISDIALNRLSDNVIAIKREEIRGKYDLIIATGVLYKQYDFLDFLNIIKMVASGFVLTSNIKEWEVSEINSLFKYQIKSIEFSYREYIQKLRLFDFRNDITT